jgi:hypothetical protein
MTKVVGVFVRFHCATSAKDGIAVAGKGEMSRHTLLPIDVDALPGTAGAQGWVTQHLLDSGRRPRNVAPKFRHCALKFGVATIKSVDHPNT